MDLPEPTVKTCDTCGQVIVTLTCPTCQKREREEEVKQAAVKQLRDMIESGEVTLPPIGEPIEVAVFGKHFTVERRAPAVVDDHGEAIDGAYTYAIEDNWLERDKVVGGVCRYCAGDGLSFYLSSARRAMLRQWTTERQPYHDVVTGRHSVRAVRGVSFDLPFAAWLVHPAAPALLLEYGIREDEARCERCGGWGDDRVRESSRAS